MEQIQVVGNPLHLDAEPPTPGALGAGRRPTLVLHPAKKDTSPAEVADHALPKRLRWQGTTLLVVDDDECVRNFVRRILVQEGFTVLLAADGVEGIAVYRQHQDTIQAALIDVTMPKLDGYGTLSALRQLRPDLPVIMTSGYAEKQMTTYVAGNQRVSFVPKPFGIAQLLDSVAAALERTAG
jgi:two-component system cell cycle sensor histidine kinase/response regulator CckA